MGDDAEAWLTPGEAIGFFDHVSENLAKDWILALLRDGLVIATAETIRYNGRPFRGSRIGHTPWNGIDSSSDSFWRLGCINVVSQNSNGQSVSYSAYRIRLNPEELSEHRPPTAPKKPDQPAKSGRRPAAWWSAFSEELAIYVNEHGLPERQEEMIEVLLQRLSDRDIEASRTTIQPVIRAIFERSRRAGN